MNWENSGLQSGPGKAALTEQPFDSSGTTECMPVLSGPLFRVGYGRRKLSDA
jgi:hypothetical protein